MSIEHRLETETVFDSGPLDELLAILGDDGTMIVGEILDAYVAEAPRLVARIDDGVQAGNLVTIRDAAHTLTSASTNVGAIALSRCCALAERAARLGDSTAAIATCELLGPLFDETVGRIENWWQNCD